jgi:transcriptional regulator with XRE-family HTH domain
MSATNKLLDEAKIKNGYKSDNQLAIALGITRGAVSHYRQGVAKPDLFTMAKLADFTGKKLEDIAATIEAEREENPIKKKYWIKKIGGIAASIVFAVLPFPTSAPNAHAASNITSMYIMLNCR